MIAGIADFRRRTGLKRWEPTEGLLGTVIFIGSVSSQGNKGQLSYAATKAGLEGASSTLMAEAIFHGVRTGIIHPGFTDTPMVRSLGEEYIQQNILPQTQLRRLIQPDEIADAICFMISNSAVSGSLWADAGWRPAACRSSLPATARFDVNTQPGGRVFGALSFAQGAPTPSGS